MLIPGKRRDLGNNGFALELGEYGKAPDGTWYCRPPEPGFPVGKLGGGHMIFEHEDGSITVTPSILSKGHDGKQWHGWLRRGSWIKER